MESWKKAILLIIIFFTIYATVGAYNYINFGSVNNTQDFEFHFKRAQGIDENQNYPKGYNFLITFFGLWKSAFFFYLVNIFLIVVIIPGVLFFASKKNWWSIAIYFMGIPLAHQIIYSATYPQALVLLYFIIYLLFRKNYLILACLTALSAMTHNVGLFLFIGIWLLEIAEIIFNKWKNKAVAITWLLPSRMEGTKGLIELFFFQLPVPVLFYAAKDFIKRFKTGALLVFESGLILISICFAAFDFRAICIAQILITIAAGHGIIKENTLIKKGFFVFLLAQTAFYFLNYIGGTITQVAGLTF